MVSFITLSTMLNSSGENSVLLCLVPCLRDCTQNSPGNMRRVVGFCCITNQVLKSLFIPDLQRLNNKKYFLIYVFPSSLRLLSDFIFQCNN